MKNFIEIACRVKNQELQKDLKSINTDIDLIYEAYDLSSEVQIVIDQLREIFEHPVEFENIYGSFIAPHIIEKLHLVGDFKFDLSKIIRFCEELNSSFNAGNFLASALLLRALIKYVPPIFGHDAFKQVVSQVSKSRRDLFKPLDEVARGGADLHTHGLIRHKEVLPTRNQLEPFKVNLEFLLQEILIEVEKNDA